MFFERSFENPVLVPEADLPWEAEGAFNGSVLREDDIIHMVYRAQSLPHLHDEGHWLSVSTIGYSSSRDGLHFKKHSQLITPQEEWERYGCEDPRIVKVGLHDHFLFYTALSTYPFSADGIRVAVATGSHPTKLTERHLVTPFNAKAMTLFPDKIDGKYWGILTANTDIPPAKVALVSFTKKEDLWDHAKWEQWYKNIDAHTLDIQRDEKDHIEVGAQPIRTQQGWVVLYSYIQNYKTDRPTFSIEALLLDLKDPHKILGKTEAPLLVPEEEYELYGKVPNIVFPSGAYVKSGKIHLYYGASDTTVCVATGDMKKLLAELAVSPEDRPMLKRYENNPILLPIPEHPWEAKAVYNPAAIRVDGITRLFYRAQSPDDTCTFGYAETKNHLDISYRHPDPAYIPRAEFEKKIHQTGNSGCEDARLTEFGDRIVMMYTAYDGVNPPRVALTSIAKKHFLAKKFEHFEMPVLISPPGIDDKDACIFPETIRGKYVIMHRIQPSIDINFFDSLDVFDGERFLYHHPFIFPRKGMWDSRKVGISSAPVKTDRGWLIFYHGVSHDGIYRVGVLLLDLNRPDKVLARSRYPLFEPEEPYEKEGLVPNVVFPCGAVSHGKTLYVYYGGGDKVTGVATISYRELCRHLNTYCSAV